MKGRLYRIVRSGGSIRRMGGITNDSKMGRIAQSKNEICPEGTKMEFPSLSIISRLFSYLMCFEMSR
jgi:hypothetical protein